MLETIIGRIDNIDLHLSCIDPTKYCASIYRYDSATSTFSIVLLLLKYSRIKINENVNS